MGKSRSYLWVVNRTRQKDKGAAKAGVETLELAPNWTRYFSDAPTIFDRGREGRAMFPNERTYISTAPPCPLVAGAP